MSSAHEIGSFRDLSRRIPSAMRSEFGRVLENLMVVKGARGAVLVDDDGYAIDYVYDPAKLADLDIQLIGAQVGQSVLRTTRTAARRDLGAPAIVIEGQRRTLVLASVSVHYVLTFVLDGNSDVVRALGHFEAVRRTVEHLLT